MIDTYAALFLFIHRAILYLNVIRMAAVGTTSAHSLWPGNAYKTNPALQQFILREPG